MSKLVAPTVHGLDLDEQTRCSHYHSAVDIVAIKMRCCREYYACSDCHAALANHSPAVWSRAEYDELAILCGQCKTELTIKQYLGCSFICPACGGRFNPGCRHHYNRYFKV